LTFYQNGRAIEDQASPAGSRGRPANRRSSDAAGRTLAIRFVKSFGFSGNDFEAAEKTLTDAGVPALPSSVFTRVMGKSYEQAAAADHWHTLKLIESHRALLIKGEGGDFRAAREASCSHEIQEIRAVATGTRTVQGVKVVAGGCCSACDALDERPYSFEQALQDLPIPRVCTASWCTCAWSAHARA
jgi:hypothetical protein